MHILVLYQYFQSPDAPGTGRHYSFVRDWARRHKVTVITSSSSFTDAISAKFPQAPKGVDLLQVPVDYSNKMGVFQRLLAFQQFARKATSLAKTVQKPDVVFATSTPLSVPWAGRRVARHWDVPWVFEVRDLWPDFPIEMGAVPSKTLQSFLRSVERGLYRDANHIIALSSDMEEHILHRSENRTPVTTLVNGTSFELLEAMDPQDPDRLRADLAVGDRKVILYAGTLGRANGITDILSVTKAVQNRKDLVFVFVGSGFYESEVSRAASDQDNVLHFPAQPKHQMFAWHAMADLSLVTFIDKPVLRTNSPSKFFDSLSAGTPVLTTNPGWTRQFVAEHECGWTIGHLDPNALADQLIAATADPNELNRRGENGRLAAHQRFDRGAMAQRLETIFQNLVADPV